MKKNKRKKSNGRPQTAYDLGHAIDMHRQGRVADAIRAYEAFFKKNQKHSECLYFWALALDQSGDSLNAAQRCRDAIRIRDDKPGYHNLLGQILFENGNHEEAAACFRKVLALAPDIKGVHNTLGLACHAMNAFDEAEDHFKRESEINASDPHPYNNLGLLYKDRGQNDDALLSFEKAIALDPGFYVAMNNQGLVYMNQGRLSEAVHCFEKALDLAPDFYKARLNLSLAFRRLGDLEKSLEHGLRVRALCPGSLDIHAHLVNTCLEQRNFDQAAAYLEEALATVSEHPELFFLKGLIFHEQGDLENAARYYGRCLAMNPHHPGAYNNSGNIFRSMNLNSDAEQCYLRAIACSPGYAEAYSNLGLLYMNLNDLDKALDYYDRAIALNLDNPNVYLSKAVLFQKTGDLPRARDCLQHALTLNPNLAAAYYHLGEIARLSGDYGNAIAHYEKALEQDPDNAMACDQLAYVLQRVCQWDKAPARIEQIWRLTTQALERGEDIDEAVHNCLSRTEDSKRIYDVAHAWSDKIFRCLSSVNPGFAHQPKAKDRITVGYLSNTFRNHPGGHLIAGLFQHHDKQRFRVICYSYGEDDQSYFRKKAEENSDLFRDIRSLDDLAVAKVIYADDVDILVDLRGHTGGSRMGICAMRPAPVQVVYLGCPSTSGADFFDYLIADPVVIPREDLPYYSEKIVYMPDCYQITNNEQSISDETITRKDQGLPEEGIVFCSFNTAYKIEPVMFDCWADILKQVPQSALWLLKDSDLMVENLQAEIVARGLSTDRLVFAERMSKERHLKRMSLADLALDTRIYTGHTTTSDALWAGVPVITMEGGHFASRVSSSILKAAGLPELVADTLDDFKRLATDFAENRDKLVALKHKIQRGKKTCHLFNTPCFASNLEKAYLIMWTRFVSGESHGMIEIKE